MIIYETNKKRLYKCDICGTVENWSDKWSWYGSLKDLDEGNDLIFVCSDACKNKLDDKEINRILLKKKLEDL